MLDLSPDKIVVVAALAFMILGPGRIPAVARSMAKARVQLRDLTKALPSETVQLIKDPRRALMDAMSDPHEADEPVVQRLPDDVSLN